MDLTDAAVAQCWDASLALEYASRAGRTVLARQEHRGPLCVQRDLYPEGAATCHSIVVHPPGGIAGGDTLAVSAHLRESCAVLLTTPGAGKWYRCSGLPARQTLDFEIASDASLEWLPQETIVFDGADAEMRTCVRLADSSIYFGWEILCLGRQASGERFTQGRLRLGTDIWLDGERLWTEQGRLHGGEPLLESPIGLAGHTVCATLVAAGGKVTNDVLGACKKIGTSDGACAGITRLPNLVIARWIGDSGEEARRYLTRLWTLLRPALRNRAAQVPRIWAT